MITDFDNAHMSGRIDRVDYLGLAHNAYMGIDKHCLHEIDLSKILLNTQMYTDQSSRTYFLN